MFDMPLQLQVGLHKQARVAGMAVMRLTAHVAGPHVLRQRRLRPELVRAAVCVQRAPRP